MAETVESMRAMIERAMKEPVDEDDALDAINDAVNSLWQSIVDANIGDFISRAPEKLTADADPIPFDEFNNSTEFIKDYAISQLFIPLHEWDQVKVWETKAARKRSELILEVLHKSPRQERVTAYNPRQSARHNTRII
jgi:hypothetical protein